MLWYGSRGNGAVSDRNSPGILVDVNKTMFTQSTIQLSLFRAFYQSAQFINWPAQSRNYRLGAQFINRVRNLEIESRASKERSVHVLFIA